MGKRIQIFAFVLVALLLVQAAAAQPANWTGKDPRFFSLVYPRIVVSTLDVAADLTLTTAQIQGGLILRDCAGGNRTDTLPTAAALLAAVPGAMVGTAFEFTVRNTSAGANTITVAPPDPSVLISGTPTVAQNNSKRFLVVFTSVNTRSPTYAVYSLGTFVH